MRDARDEVSAALLPAGEAYSFARDERGRTSRACTGTGGGQEGLLLGHEHDAQHNVIAETDARGARTAYAHDGMGRPVAQTDALGRTTRVTYDPMGRLSAISPALAPLFRAATRCPTASRFMSRPRLSDPTRATGAHQQDSHTPVHQQERNPATIRRRATQPSGATRNENILIL